ncbi:MAG: ATP-binding protein [Akkermansia sp.]|nr:ATP-binding protein [Akkermansia sp.]
MEMYRKGIEQLERWKTRARRKPLLLLGARQVGKTWLLQEFGRRSFRQVAYLRFDRNATARGLFEEHGSDTARLLNQIQAEVGFAIVPGETLLVLDEIQECPAALSSLKYLCEDMPELHVAAAGSMLGVRQHEGTGFPVGKVNTLMLHPMSFTEFLRALGKGVLAAMVEEGDWEGMHPFHARLTEYLRLYYYVGGMPEAVSTYATTQDYAEVRELQQELLENYERDFSKHVPTGTAAKIGRIWDSIPLQLARENKRFMYGEVRKGARAKELEDAMDWLLRAGLIYHCQRIKKPDIPIKSYWDGAFKVYVHDVGLLGAKAGLDVATLLHGNRIFTEFKGALTEQYVQQQLRAELGISPCYWLSETSHAEIDFLFQHGMDVVPVEVKAEINLQAKSLKSYCKRFSAPRAVRTSMAHFAVSRMKEGATLVDLPLYAVCRMQAELERESGA